MVEFKYGTNDGMERMKHKHLTLSDRIEIELGVTQGSSFREICR